MKKPNSHQLLFGPYLPPKVRRGDKLFCEIRGTVTVGGYSDGPICWPRIQKGGAHCLIICGDLVRAVKQESLIAVAHNWGVSQTTGWKWRKVLGAKRWNEGSTQLGREWAMLRDDDRLERARRNSKKPAALAKASASLKGRVQTLATIEAPRKAPKQSGSRVRYFKHRQWIAREDALLGTARDQVIAKRLGRSLNSVRMRRFVKRISRFGKIAAT